MSTDTDINIELSNCEWAVVEAAVKWREIDLLFDRELDDAEIAELRNTADALIAAREKAEKNPSD